MIDLTNFGNIKKGIKMQTITKAVKLLESIDLQWYQAELKHNIMQGEGVTLPQHSVDIEYDSDAGLWDIYDASGNIVASINEDIYDWYVNETIEQCNNDQTTFELTQTTQG